jgi:hypothetical protein
VHQKVVVSLPGMHAKLIQFTLLISVGGRQREFNFRQRTTELYNVNTHDDRGERYYFDIVSEGGMWKFRNVLMPTWLSGSEEVIIGAFQMSEHFV